MRPYKFRYLKGVVSRLTSLGKVALDVVAPVVVEMGVDVLISKACDKIELLFKQVYKKTVINSGITFLINLVGILCLALRPFGFKASAILAIGCFAGSTIFFLARVILWCRSYGSQAIEISKNIWYAKNIHKGIERYVLSTFPFITLAYAGIDIGAVYVPSLKNVPHISQLIDFFVRYFWNKVALFVGIILIYTIIVLWIIKPILIHKYW